jgi:hypothetical protein
MSQKFLSEVTLLSLNNATTDTDRFLVSDSGTIKYRTGSQLLSDLGVSGIYVPYTGATGNVDLGTHTLLAKDLIINHSSGSGIAASITKNGSGEALTVIKGSGSGNAMSVTGGLTSLVDLTLSSIPNATIDTDRFLVSDSGAIKYRTGAEVLSDIGAQAALTNPVTGTGTLNFVSKFTSTGSTLGDSQIFDNGTNVGIGTVSPSAKLDIRAQGALSSDLTFVVKNSADTVKLIEANGAGGIDIRSTPGNRLTLSNTVEASFDITDTGGHSKRFFLRNSDKTLGIYNNDAGQQRTQLRLVTGAAASSDRLSLLEAGGNVGIGTTTPGTKLEVNSGASTGPTLRLSTTGISVASNALIGEIDFYNSDATTPGARSASYIRSFSAGTSGGGDLRFGISANAATVSEAMRIASTGNVGIGTTTPTAIGTNIITLDIKGSIGGGVRSGVLGGSESTFYTIAAGGYLGTISNIPLNFQTNNSVKATILASGNVGIGTTVPDTLLHVSSLNSSILRLESTNTALGLDAVVGEIQFEANDASGSGTGVKAKIGAYSDVAAGNAVGLRFFTGDAGFTTGTEKMRISASGNVGIGTTSPAVRLNVVGGDAAFDFGGFANVPAVKLLRAGDEPTLRFYRPSGGTPDARIFQIQNTVGDLTFGYALANKYSESTFTEAMRITSISNVGIGVTNPVDKLDVNGAIRFRVNTSSFTGAIDSGLIDFVPTSIFPTDPQVRLAAIGTATVGASIAFQTGVNSGSVTERMRITSSGNVGIGTTNPTSRVHSVTSVSGPVSYDVRCAVFGYNTSTDTIYNNPVGIAGRVLTSGGIAVYGDATTGGGWGGYFDGKGYFSGRVGIGTTSPSYPLQVATQVSNISIYANYDIVAFSDKSVKDNIRSIENVIERIQKSRGVLYDRIDSNEKNNIGFIAQELEIEFPELVVTNENGTKAVKYQNTVAVLFEAIKEQQKQIEELKQIVNGLTK